jgi:hypothetical protein
MIRTSALVGCMTLAASLGLAGPAAAKDGAEARARGACSRSSDWELRARASDGRLEVRFEVDSDRRGQRWLYTLRVDGTVAASGSRTTGSGGAFRVQRTQAGEAGVAVSATARNPRTREWCRASVRI